MKIQSLCICRTCNRIEDIRIDSDWLDHNGEHPLHDTTGEHIMDVISIENYLTRKRTY